MRGDKIFFFKKLFIWVVLMLYTEFQSSTMPGTGQKVCCGGGWVVVVVETNYSAKLCLKLNKIHKFSA